MTFLSKFFAALNPNNRPINPPAVEDENIILCGFDTKLSFGNYDHSALETWAGETRLHANDLILFYDSNRYDMLNRNMAENEWHTFSSSN